MWQEFNFYGELFVAVILVFCLWQLIHIRCAAERTAKVAEREEKARAEHRRKTTEEREHERNGKKLSAAINVMEQIRKSLESVNEITIFDSWDYHPAPPTKDGYFPFMVRFGNEHSDDELLMNLWVLPMTGNVAQVQAQIAEPDRIIEEFLFPHQKDDIVAKFVNP